jgi:hypothetical protein
VTVDECADTSTKAQADATELRAVLTEHRFRNPSLDRPTRNPSCPELHPRQSVEAVRF